MHVKKNLSVLEAKLMITYVKKHNSVVKKKRSVGSKKFNESNDSGNDDSIKLITLLSIFIASHSSSSSDSLNKSNQINNDNQLNMSTGMLTIKKIYWNLEVREWRWQHRCCQWTTWCWCPTHNDIKGSHVANKPEYHKVWHEREMQTIIISKKKYS